MNWLQKRIALLRRRDADSDDLNEINSGSSKQHHSDIHGGISLARCKPGLPSTKQLRNLNVPQHILLPLLDYHDNELIPSVAVGQTVKTGQPIAKGIIASCNGTVAAIGSRLVIHPSRQEASCVEILADNPCAQNLHEQAVFDALPELTIERIQACAIRGLGGAGYETAVKVSSGKANTQHIHTLVINAVECEPFISCDESLMMVSAEEIILAVHAMIKLTQCHRCLFAIENDKTIAIDCIERAYRAFLDTSNASFSIEFIQLPPVYPTGAERVLLQRLTGFDPESRRSPTQAGLICLNVATVHAAWKAQQGYPLVSRVVSVTGPAANNPCNVRVRFGTTVRQLLIDTDNHKLVENNRVRAGGPLSGFDLINLDVPITATTNCIAIESTHQDAVTEPCIRCSQCSTVCPSNLLPQQLYWYCRDNQIDQAKRFGLDQCIECGCCDLVCPSNIPLTQSFRHTKSTQRQLLQLSEVATQAKNNFEQHQDRLNRQEKQKSLQRKQVSQTLNEGKNDVADAILRAKRRRHQRINRNPSDDPTPTNQNTIETNSGSTSSSNVSVNTDRNNSPPGNNSA